MYYTLTEDESLQKLSQQAEEKINKRNNCYSHNNHSSSNDTGVDGGGGCDDDSYTNIINSNSDSCRSESDSNSTSNGNSNSNSNSSSSSSNNNNKEYKIVVETAVETEYKKVVNADAIDLFPEKEIGPRSSPSSSSSSASSLSSEATSSMNPSSFEGGGGVPYVGSGGEEYTSRTTTATMADPSLCAPSPPPITSRRRSNSRSLSRISVEDGTILCSPPVSLDNTENANGDDDDHHHHHHHHHRHHEEGSVSAESNTCSTPSEGGVRYSVVIHTQELGLNIDPNTGIIQDVTNEELLSAPIVSASEIIIHGDKVVQIGNTQLFDGNTVVYVPDIIADNTQRPITIVIERDPTLYCFVDGPFYNRGIDNDDIDHRFNRSDVGMDNNDDTIILPTAE